MGEGRRIKVKWKVLPLCTTLQTRMPWLPDTGSLRGLSLSSLADPLDCTELRRPLPSEASYQLAPGKGHCHTLGAQSEPQGTLPFTSSPCLPK